mgnify:CR=1 FL=1
MLINCVAYRDGSKVADISPEDISDWLVKPGCFVWVALRDATDAELAQMQEEFGLHELAVEDARHGHQRPKLEEYGQTLFVVLQLLEADKGELHIGELAIFVGLLGAALWGLRHLRTRRYRLGLLACAGALVAAPGILVAAGLDWPGIGQRAIVLVGVALGWLLVSELERFRATRARRTPARAPG